MRKSEELRLLDGDLAEEAVEGRAGTFLQGVRWDSSSVSSSSASAHEVIAGCRASFVFKYLVSNLQETYRWYGQSCPQMWMGSTWPMSVCCP